MKPLKIVYIVSHTYHSKQWEWLMEALVAYGDLAITFVIIGKREWPLVSNLQKIGIHVEVIDENYSHLGKFLRILHLLIKLKPKVIQTEMPLGNLLGLVGGFLLGVKKRLMTSSNVTWAEDFGSYKQKLIDFLSYRLATSIINQTDLSKAYLVQKHKIPPSKLHTIWHAVKVEEYDRVSQERIEKLKKYLNIQPTDFVVGMIARYEHWKGHAYLVRAVPTIMEHVSCCKIFLFGSGPEKARIAALVESMGLSHVVCMVDFVEDIIALYRCLDVQVHVPINKWVETFGITILDGMASGVAQVLTLSGIANDVAKHLENALVVPYQDSEAIAQAVIRLYHDPWLRKKLAYEARAFAVQNFSLAKKVQKHKALYFC
ncbi:MAG: glycosyltransferase family 4 protein [Bacteroidia bacterium]